MTALLLALWLGANQPRTIDVDLIELNRTTTEHGCSFEQVILWEWNAEFRRHDVTDWWMLEEDQVRHAHGGLFCIDRLGTKVRSSIFIRTHTSFDPERANTRLLPSDLRASRL